MARAWGGIVSAISVAAVAKAPPIPHPIKKAVDAEIDSPTDKPDSPVNTE